MGTPYRYDYQGAYAQKDGATNWNNFGLRMYDGKIGRWLTTDPKGQFASPYEGMGNDPVNGTDPTGGLDWVKDSNGNISWDPNATSPGTTPDGETYLGKTLTFNFDSFIDKNLWDGPFGNAPGDKMRSVINITGVSNNDGELVGINAMKTETFGNTPIGYPRDSYPGLGDNQNIFTYNQSVNQDNTLYSYNLNFEQHASVNSFEEFGLSLMNYDIPDVGQKLNISYLNGNLSFSVFTDQFPSATLTLNGQKIMYYPQPSFQSTFYNPNINTEGGYIPAKWFQR